LAFLLVRTTNRPNRVAEAVQAAEAANPVQVAPTMKTRKRTRHLEALLEAAIKVQVAPKKWLTSRTSAVGRAMGKTFAGR
jgi:hypothetical protein